jgi:3'-phosphoadenosine 5'-phosphosulfate sulfotransferase (PAPS reductase)/FAD synthetase
MMPSWITRRVDSAAQIIHAFTAEHTPYVSMSWGKDSMVLLWLVRRLGLTLPVIWFDGGLYDEHPDTAAFAQAVCEHWGITMHIARPEIPLVEQWRRFGVPTGRATREDDAYTQQFVGALRRESERLGCDGALLGMRGDESVVRRAFVFKRRGHTYYVQRDRTWHCSPLWNWSTSDVWTLIDDAHIPVHPVYRQTRFQRREQIRLGVHAETAFAHWGSLAHFRHYYPHLWNQLCLEFPEVASHG